MRDANQAIALFLGGSDVQSSVTSKNIFVDVHQKMLTASGEPIAELFLDDSLHMNSKGYAIWQETIKPYLIK